MSKDDGIDHRRVREGEEPVLPARSPNLVGPEHDEPVVVLPVPEPWVSDEPILPAKPPPPPPPEKKS